jgi:hypothetical protein
MVHRPGWVLTCEVRDQALQGFPGRGGHFHCAVADAAGGDPGGGHADDRAGVAGVGGQEVAAAAERERRPGMPVWARSGQAARAAPRHFHFISDSRVS